jgi:hypothetical protein
MAAQLRRGQPVLPPAFGKAGLPVYQAQRDALGAARGSNGYGPVAGLPTLRSAAAGYWERRYLPTSAGAAVCGPGSKPPVTPPAHSRSYLAVLVAEDDSTQADARPPGADGGACAPHPAARVAERDAGGDGSLGTAVSEVLPVGDDALPGSQAGVKRAKEHRRADGNPYDDHPDEPSPAPRCASSVLPSHAQTLPASAAAG